MKKHEDNPWFNGELINFEKAAEPHLKRAIKHLTGVKEEEEHLEYGENIRAFLKKTRNFTMK